MKVFSLFYIFTDLTAHSKNYNKEFSSFRNRVKQIGEY
jgi:hypothetical protein